MFSTHLRSSTLVSLSLVASIGATACSDDAAQDDEVGETSSDSSDTTSDTEGTTSTDGTTDATSTEGTTTDATTDATTGEEDIQVTLNFGAAVGDQPAACGQSYEGLGSEGTTVQIQDLRFFVSAIELLDAQGNATPLALDQDGLWQYADVALLDFEDGTSACQDAGTAELNDVVVGSVPAGDYTGVRFSLGVPFELNHQDPASAPSPLNLPSMFWVWQGGHKFARLDLLNDNPDGNAWFWHQGSTGCASSGPETPPENPCLRPNRLEVEFQDLDWSAQTIVFDVEMLLAGVDVSQNTPMTAPGCMSAPDDPECMELFPKLGLDLMTGQCSSDCSDQQVFRVE